MERFFLSFFVVLRMDFQKSLSTRISRQFFLFFWPLDLFFFLAFMNAHHDSSSTSTNKPCLPFSHLLTPLTQPRKDPFISHPLPSKFSTSESLFLPIGMNCQVLPLIETSSSRLQLRSHIAGSLQFPIPTLACPSTSVSIPRPPLLVPSALTKASRTPSHPYSNIHPGPIRNEPTPRPEYYSGQKRKRLLHPAPEKEMKKPKSSKEGTNKEPPFHENSLIFSPCFQCFTTIRFYAKLCNELLEVCEELDKPANTDTRIIIWNYLFWITGFFFVQTRMLMTPDQ